MHIGNHGKYDRHTGCLLGRTIPWPTIQRLLPYQADIQFKRSNQLCSCLFNLRSSKFYIPAHSTCQRPLDIGEISNSDPEVKKTIEVFVDKANDQSNHINEAIEKSYGLGVTLQAKEVISYQPDVRKITSLSVSEVNEAEREIVKFLRKQKFKEELSALSIYKLDPALENSLILVGGCLHQAPIMHN